MKLLAPPYVFPPASTRMWGGLVEARQHIGHVIVNPGSGPGHVRDPIWIAQLRALEAAELAAVGYLDLSYTRKPLSRVLAEVETWRKWYGVTDFFLDCLPSGDHGRARAVTRVLRDRPRQLLANPGVATTPEVAAHFDLLVTYEGTQPPQVRRPWLAAPQASASRRASGPATAWIHYDAPREVIGRTVRSAAAAGVSELWVTDLSGANPYRELPSYWEQLLTAVERV